MIKYLHFILIIISLNFFSQSIAQWTNGGTLLSKGERFNNKPVLSATKEGAAFIAWTATDEKNKSILYMSCIDANGNLLPGWKQGGNIISEPANTESPFGNYNYPIIITSEDGAAIVAWYGYENEATQSFIYAQKYSLNAKAIWNKGKPVKISQKENYSDEYPIIITDNHNGFFAVWNRYETANSFDPDNYDIWLQHIDSTGNIANNWNSEGMVVDDIQKVRQYYPRLALSPDETIIYVLYSEGFWGSSLKLKKLSALDGKIDENWPSEGFYLSKGPAIFSNILNDQFIFCDNFNNAVLFWNEMQKGSLNGEIYAQIVNPLGQSLLSPKGKYIGGNLNNGAGYIEVIRDKENNYFLTFNDYSVNRDVAAIKLDSKCNTLWENYKITTNHNSGYSKAVPDGNKGIFIFYKNLNKTPPLLYALSIDSLGNVNNSWGAAGTYFGETDSYNTSRPNYDVSVVANKEGMAIVAWNRINGKYEDIYSCNLLASGKNCILQYSNINKEPKLTSSAIYPNPFKKEIFINYNNFATLQLFDFTGKLIFTQITKNNQSINLSYLPKGIYFYILSAQNKLIHKNILIKQ